MWELFSLKESRLKTVGGGKIVQEIPFSLVCPLMSVLSSFTFPVLIISHLVYFQCYSCILEILMCTWTDKEMQHCPAFLTQASLELVIKQIQETTRNKLHL